MNTWIKIGMKYRRLISYFSLKKYLIIFNAFVGNRNYSRVRFLIYFLIYSVSILKSEVIVASLWTQIIFEICFIVICWTYKADQFLFRIIFCRMTVNNWNVIRWILNFTSKLAVVSQTLSPYIRSILTENAIQWINSQIALNKRYILLWNLKYPVNYSSSE